MFHLMSGLPEVELSAVCGMNEAVQRKVQTFAGKHGLKLCIYSDFGDFIKHDMDAVICAGATSGAMWANLSMARAPISMTGLIAANPHGEPDIPPEVYAYVKALWRTGKAPERQNGNT